MLLVNNNLWNCSNVMGARGRQIRKTNVSAVVNIIVCVRPFCQDGRAGQKKQTYQLFISLIVCVRPSCQVGMAAHGWNCGGGNLRGFQSL